VLLIGIPIHFDITVKYADFSIRTTACQQLRVACRSWTHDGRGRSAVSFI